VTSETFTNEIINAIRYRTTEEFRAKYRSVDILLVDDIQFIAGKDSTEEEFFHTFNSLHEAHKQIVICSDRPPKAIDLAERLRSRFEWGLIADIQPPDLETRVAILRVKAETLGYDIDDQILTFLANRPQNVRELEGMLNRVLAYAKLQKNEISLEMAKQALSPLAQSEQRHYSQDDIIQAVSTYYRISIAELKGKRRDRHIVMPRQVAMWLMRADSGMTVVTIGGVLGGRDHSTVLHGCDKIDYEIEREGSSVAQEIAAIRQSLGRQV
jgi:chromosomal replication initiator protein